MAGGFYGGVVSSEASAYDPGTGQWTSLPPMSVARYTATAVALNGLLYVMGGYTAFGAPLTTVEVHNPVTKTWRTVTGMPTARWWLGAGAINGKVYAVGGHRDATLAVNQVYIP
jgi:N-acetylneuraminic acid mutarotase